MRNLKNLPFQVFDLKNKNMDFATPPKMGQRVRRSGATRTQGIKSCFNDLLKVKPIGNK